MFKIIFKSIQDKEVKYGYSGLVVKDWDFLRGESNKFCFCFHSLDKINNICHFLCKGSGHFHRVHGRRLVADAFLNVDQVLHGHLLHTGQIQAVVLLALELIGLVELHDIVHCCFLSKRQSAAPRRDG